MANICTHVSGKDHSNRNKKMLCTINHQTLLFHGPYPMEKYCTRRYPLCSQRKVHSSHWILSSVGFSVDKAVCSVSKPWAVCSAPSMKTTVHENHRSHCNTHLEGVTLMEMAWGSKGQGSWHKRLTPRCWETVSMGGVKQDINWVGKCVCKHWWCFVFFNKVMTSATYSFPNGCYVLRRRGDKVYSRRDLDAALYSLWR